MAKLQARHEMPGNEAYEFRNPEGVEHNATEILAGLIDTRLCQLVRAWGAGVHHGRGCVHVARRKSFRFKNHFVRRAMIGNCIGLQ